MRIKKVNGLLLLISGLILLTETGYSKNKDLKTISNQYIVVFKDSAVEKGKNKGAEMQRLSSELMTRYNGKIKEVYGYVLMGFVGNFSENVARKIAKEKNVKYVSQDVLLLQNTTTQLNPPWGLDRIDQTALPLNLNYNYNSEGNGVTAYVVDTGIRQSHSEFGGRAGQAYDVTGGAGNDSDGHGTHVAGSIGGTWYGVAKKVNLQSIRVMDSNGTITTSAVIGGLNWIAVNHVKPAVVNISLGGKLYDNYAQDEAVDNLVNLGIPVVVAAGNQNEDASLYSPARVPKAITVGAVDNGDTKPTFSNFGASLDLFAPGVGIRSAGIVDNYSHSDKSGTSMAAPHVAGVVALILGENPHITPANIQKTLIANSVANVVSSPGTGSPNRLLQSNTSLTLAGWASQEIQPRLSADVNGDGKSDIIAFDKGGAYVSISNGTSYSNPKRWIANFGHAQGWTDQNAYPRMMADVNGDGKADIVGFSANGVYVSLSTGTSFAASTAWYIGFTAPQGWTSQQYYPRMMADVNGDGKADIIGFSANGVYVSLSTGTSFASGIFWIGNFTSPQGWVSMDQYPRTVADVNGDGKADIVGFSANGVYVSLSTGTSFAASTAWYIGFTAPQGWTSFNTYPRMMADINGDGKADLVGFSASGVYAAISTGASFATDTYWSSSYTVAQGWTTQYSYPRVLADANGDGKADIVGFATVGTWVANSTGTIFNNGSMWTASFGLLE